MGGMGLPKRKRNRLPEYDYSAPNVYFITVCTEKRRSIFWEDVGATIGRPQDVRLSRCGKIVNQAILKIPQHYPTLTIEHYVVMPNHIHLLLKICTDDYGRPLVAPTISTVIQQMKGVVTKQLGYGIWQKSFHDHIIRNERDYLKIWEYIDCNPMKWTEDCFYTM